MNSEDKATLIGILGVVLIVAVVAVAIVATVVISDSTTRDELPRCREGQVLVGFGDFARGHWDEYTCAWLAVEENTR